MPRKITVNGFTDSLVSSPCSHDGCRNRTVMSQPYCWIHLLKDRKLRIRKSTIRGAGQGLFAQTTWKVPSAVRRVREAVAFKKGEQIIPYVGEILSAGQLAERYGRKTAPYALKMSRDRFVDAAFKRGAGGMANDPRNSTKRPNARFSLNSRGTYPSIKASRTIYSGEEVLVPYGAGYWRTR